MTNFILLPGWVHFCLLSVLGSGLFILARHFLHAYPSRIPLGLVRLSFFQIALAIAALSVTYMASVPSGNDFGCWIGIVGYGLNGFALVATGCLLVWMLVKPRYWQMNGKVYLAVLICLAGLLSAETLAIHARSLAYCIGSI